MKSDIYKINNNIEKLVNEKHTLFLDQRELSQIQNRVGKNKYKVYYPNKSSEKVILYNNEKPDISLFKIITNEKLRHQDILGSLLGMNISSSYIGDIIIDNDNYYFYIFSSLSNYLKDNLNMIGNKKISLEKIDIDYLKDYERKYEENNLIVSSLRIDTVIANIIKTNRKNVLDKIKNKEVIINYEILKKSSYILKENDIFSIRKYGKYKFIGVVNNTKKNNYVIKYLKYL